MKKNWMLVLGMLMAVSTLSACATKNTSECGVFGAEDSSIILTEGDLSNILSALHSNEDPVRGVECSVEQTSWRSSLGAILEVTTTFPFEKSLSAWECGGEIEKSPLRDEEPVSCRKAILKKSDLNGNLLWQGTICACKEGDIWVLASVE